tara:strand:+ start:16564 stop:16791 length:228 start_codon:yes stop_codon:yes gene_type:complete
MNIQDALDSLTEIENAAQQIRDELEAAVDDVDQQIEDGELDKRDREDDILEILNGVSEPIGLIAGAARDLAEVLS